MVPAEVVARGRGVEVCLCFVCVCVGGTADGGGGVGFVSRAVLAPTSLSEWSPSGAHHATESWSLCCRKSREQLQAPRLSKNAPEPESQVPQPILPQGFYSRPHAKNAMARTARGAITVNPAIGPLRRLRRQARLFGSTLHSADARNMLKDAQDGIPKHP